MLEITIDGKKVTAKEGSTILEVAREHDIPIPTLCYYEEVSPGGRCRLCTVEITSPKKKPPLVLACAHPVEKGMEIQTHSEEVVASRRAEISVLLGRAPDAEKIQQTAKEIGVEVEPSRLKGTGCILCGLCVRACKEIVGRSAISLKSGSSAHEKKETPIQASPEKCIGCGTCAYLCPTGYIKMEDYGDVRIIWGKVFKTREHLISGKFYAPSDLIQYMEQREGVDIDRLNDPAASCLKKWEMLEREKCD